MAQLNDFQIALDKSSNCGYITVQDLTTYPYSTKERSEIGLACFYSDDAFVSSEAILNNSSSDMTFATLNNKTYIVRVFVVDAWENGSYANLVIVWFDCYFYQNQSAGPTAEEPGHGTDWVVLTEDDYAVFELELYTGSSSNYGYVEASEQTTCSLFSIERTGDHEFTVTDNSNGATINYANVYDYEGNLLSEHTFSDSLIGLTLAEDSAQYIEISYNDNDIVQLPIFDLTNARTCMMALTNYIMCSCSDPCDAGCNEDLVIKRKRIELNNLSILYWAILGFVYTDRIKYLGIISSDESRVSFNGSVATMI